MSAKSKVYSSFDDAVRDIPDGATLGFGGFAVVGMPINLYGAVAKQGAKNLTCVSNSTRGGATLPGDAPDMGQIIKNGQVERKVPYEDLAKTGTLGRISFQKSGWFLVRVITESPKTFRFASTGPYYV